MSGQRFMTESDRREKDASLRALVEAAKLREENAELRAENARLRADLECATEFFIPSRGGVFVYRRDGGWSVKVGHCTVLRRDGGTELIPSSAADGDKMRAHWKRTLFERDEALALARQWAGEEPK